MDGHTKPCCGACGHAAEVARRGGAAPNDNPHLRVSRDADGSPSGVSLVLHVRGRHLEDEIVPIQRARVVLGRTPPADIVVEMAELSRRQCAFDFSTGEVVVEDLMSACGTYVNGEQIDRPRALRAGDEVRVGDLIICVRLGA